MGVEGLKHVAIIMDGNGRWAEQRGLPRNAGHARGVEAIMNTILSLSERNVSYLSLFAFGQENWSRPESEVKGLFSLGLKALAKYIKVLIANKVKLRFIGDLSALPRNLYLKAKFAQEVTQKCTGLEVIIALSYSGRWDIANAVQQLINTNPQNISNEDLQQQLSQYLQISDIPDPDLFIRTSGEQRISNFYLWQLAYTELYFTDVFWPDFDTAELDKALADFVRRERRYGKTSIQVQNVTN